jgi:hypothetical protein
MTVRPIAPGDRDTPGYRFYDAQPAILAGCEQTQIIYLPDRSRGYAAQPHAWLAKNVYELEIENGMLKKTKGTLETTAFLSFLGDVASEAIEAADKLGMLSGSGRVARQPTLYVIDFDESGRISGLRNAGTFGECPAPSPPASGRPASGGKKKGG